MKYLLFTHASQWIFISKIIYGIIMNCMQKYITPLQIRNTVTIKLKFTLQYQMLPNIVYLFPRWTLVQVDLYGTHILYALVQMTEKKI